MKNEAVVVTTSTPGGAINQPAASLFEVGDRVVHPQYGVGQIIKLEDREFERGDSHRYYEINIPGGSTVWVPVDLSNSGLRRLAHKRELAQCREILRAHPQPLTEDGRVRQSTLVERLRQGTIVAQCEVVRDLFAFVSHKPSYGAISSFLEAMLSVLCQEWSMVEEVSMSEARFEISTLLDKRR